MFDIDFNYICLKAMFIMCVTLHFFSLFCTSTKEVMFSVCFVCLFVSRITHKQT